LTEPTDAEYPVRAAVYRLLVAHAALVLTCDPQGPSVSSRTLDATMADKKSRHVVTYLDRRCLYSARKLVTRRLAALRAATSRFSG
jgi:CRISPR/Cas system-associated endonuclease Cas1